MSGGAVKESSPAKQGRMVSTKAKSIRVNVQVTDRDIRFINKNIKSGGFSDVNAVITGCLRRVRKEMAKKEIARLHAQTAREAARIKLLSSSLRQIASGEQEPSSPKAIKGATQKQKQPVKRRERAEPREGGKKRSPASKAKKGLSRSQAQALLWVGLLNVICILGFLAYKLT